MAGYLSELGGMKCRDERGHSVPCPRTLGCGLGGCLSGDKKVPFDLPLIGGEASFDVTDALVGVVGGKAATGVALALVRYLGKENGAKYANWGKIGIGALALGGLASQRLRDSSLFLGFSFATIPEMAEPVTDFLALNTLKLIDKLAGTTLVTAGANAGYRGLRGDGEGYEVTPRVQSPRQLIATGSKNMSKIGTSMLGATQMNRRQVASMRTR